MCECRCEPTDAAAENRRAEWRRRHRNVMDGAAATLIVASGAGAVALGTAGAAALGIWIGATAGPAALALTMLPERSGWPVTFGSLIPAWGVAAGVLTLS